MFGPSSACLGSLWFGLVLAIGLDQPGRVSTFYTLVWLWWQNWVDGQWGGPIQLLHHVTSLHTFIDIKIVFLDKVFSKGHLDHHIFPFYSRCFQGRFAIWVLYQPVGFCVIISFSQIFALLFKEIYLRRQNVQSSPFKTIFPILCKIWREDWGVSDWIGITLNQHPHH